LRLKQQIIIIFSHLLLKFTYRRPKTKRYDPSLFLIDRGSPSLQLYWQLNMGSCLLMDKVTKSYNLPLDKYLHPFGPISLKSS